MKFHTSVPVVTEDSITLQANVQGHEIEATGADQMALWDDLKSQVATALSIDEDEISLKPNRLDGSIFINIPDV